MMPLRVVVLLFANANHAGLNFLPTARTRGALFNQIAALPDVSRSVWGKKSDRLTAVPIFPLFSLFFPRRFNLSRLSSLTRSPWSPNARPRSEYQIKESEY